MANKSNGDLLPLGQAIRGRKKPMTTQNQSQKRRGVAAVEFAVCLPVIVLLVFGSIEASSFIFLKQSLNVAAYEGIRESIRVGSSNADGIDRAENILNSRNVRDFQITFPVRSATGAPRGEEIVIEVSAPTETNSPLAGQWVSNRVLTARVVMVKE
jgi:hypothetical protein